MNEYDDLNLAQRMYVSCPICSAMIMQARPFTAGVCHRC